MKKMLIVIAILIAGCQSKPDHTTRIVIDRGHGAVAVSGIPQMALNGMRDDSLPAEAIQQLFPVRAMPADTSLREDEPLIKGRYAISGSLIVFIPDTPFVAGRSYFARYFRFDEKITPTDLVLHRRKLSVAPYTELIFKY